MKILAHRGIWKNKKKQNTLSALKNALLMGYGVEFDIRDYEKSIVISHDMPKSKAIKLQDFLKIYNDLESNCLLAINIKSDGIGKKLKSILDKLSITNYITFDMSIPEQVVYSRNKIKFLSRLSDIEKIPILIEKSKGLWVDNFSNFLFNDSYINKMIEQNKTLVFVSPELHKSKKNLWSKLVKYNSYKKIYICTDYVEKANEYFNNQKNDL